MTSLTKGNRVARLTGIAGMHLMGDGQAICRLRHVRYAARALVQALGAQVIIGITCAMDTDGGESVKHDRQGIAGPWLIRASMARNSWSCVDLLWNGRHRHCI